MKTNIFRYFINQFFLIGIIFIITTKSSFAQELRTIKNEAFIRGEELRYRVYYQTLITGKVTAGEATLEVKNSNKQIAGRNTYHMVGLGLTKGAFNLFFRVVDRYETYMDEEALVPWVFIRRVNEGGYKIEQDIAFNQFKNEATDLKKNKTYQVTEFIQDMISGFYYARAMDFTNAKIGDSFTITTFLDWEIYPMKIKITGKEKITTSLGTFNCIRLMPQLQIGNVFKDEEDMSVWVTDDKNRIPILAEANILVGSVKMELIKYSGLANPLTSKIK